MVSTSSPAAGSGGNSRDPGRSLAGSPQSLAVARFLDALHAVLERFYRAPSLSEACRDTIDELRLLVSPGKTGGIALLLPAPGQAGLACLAASGLSPSLCRWVAARAPGLRAALPTADPGEAIPASAGGEPAPEGVPGDLVLYPLVFDGLWLGELAARHGEEGEPEGWAARAGAVGRHLAMAIGRRSAEDRSVHDNQHRLRLALEAGRMGTWEWEVDTGRMYWSANLSRLHGRPPGWFSGRFADYPEDMHPEDRAAVVASLERAAERDAEHHMVYRIVLPDDSIRWIEARGRVFRGGDGRPRRMIGLCMDVTDRQQYEEQITTLSDVLRRRIEELNALLDVLPVGVLVAHDPECRHMSANPAAARLLGLSPEANPSRTAGVDEELPFRVFRDGRPVAAEDMPLQRAARTGKPVLDEILEIRREDGSVFYEYITAVPLFDEEGNVRGALGAMVDLTERKRFEDALRASDRRKDEFLATLAHELRNPLAPVRTAVDLLLAGRADNLKASGEEGPEAVIDRQIRHMARLLDDLLDVSRITYNKLVLRRERIELSVPVQSALETSRPLIEERGHQLMVRMPGVPVYLDADPVRLAQVFSNLLTNAACYTRRGGRVDFIGEVDGGELCVRVRDNGIGIAPEAAPGIFGLFSRGGSGARQRRAGGLGVGLSLARKLTELHGGRIEVSSAGEGRGSEFRVRLPVASAPAQVSAPERPPKRGCEPRQRRILVVDDLRDNADSLAMLLTLAGHEAEVAYGGRAALRAAERFRPEVVLLDIGMPDLDGYEVCRRLRQQPGTEDAVLIALTGWGQASDRERSCEAGFDHHLVKPVDAETILARVDGGRGQKA